MLFRSKNSAGAVVRFAAVARKACESVPMQCNPPSGSVFPVGTTQVTCVYGGVAGQTLSCSFPVVVTCNNLAAAVVNGTVTLTWDSGATLQTSENVNGPWSDVSGAKSPFHVNSFARHRFFQLIDRTQ
mgnify:CR=1 FL=1